MSVRPFLQAVKRSLQLILIAVILTATPVMAEEILRVAFDEHPPWKILDEKGRPTGVDIELLRLVAERLELKLEFVRYPFKRSLRMIELGEVDIMTGVLHRPEREAMFHYMEPPYKSNSDKAFFALKGHNLHVRRHNDLHTLHIGTQLGHKYYPEFDQDNQIEKHPVRKVDLNIKMLLDKRIDAFIITEATGEYHIAKLDLTDRIVKLDYAYRNPQPVYMVLSKISPYADRLHEFSQTLKEIVGNGTVDRLKKEFYNSLTP